MLSVQATVADASATVRSTGGAPRPRLMDGTGLLWRLYLPQETYSSGSLLLVSGFAIRPVVSHEPSRARRPNGNWIPISSQLTQEAHADLTFFSLLTGVLRFMGLNVLNHSSDLNEEQRAGIIADFNDTKKRGDVAIFTLELSLVGVNMHYTCHHGMFLAFTDNPASGKQVQGRLVRSGQKEIVYWYIIKQVGSYADVQERMVHTKQAQFHKAQALVPNEATRSLRDIICYELAREEWGTLESNLGSMCVQSTRASSAVVSSCGRPRGARHSQEAGAVPRGTGHVSAKAWRS